MDRHKLTTQGRLHILSCRQMAKLLTGSIIARQKSSSQGIEPTVPNFSISGLPRFEQVKQGIDQVNAWTLGKQLSL